MDCCSRRICSFVCQYIFRTSANKFKANCLPGELFEQEYNGKKLTNCGYIYANSATVHQLQQTSAKRRTIVRGSADYYTFCSIGKLLSADCLTTLTLTVFREQNFFHGRNSAQNSPPRTILRGKPIW